MADVNEWIDDEFLGACDDCGDVAVAGDYDKERAYCGKHTPPDLAAVLLKRMRREEI